MSTSSTTLPADGRRGPRSRGCASAFDDAGIDALLVTRLPNVRYLTGFTGSAGDAARHRRRRAARHRRPLQGPVGRAARRVGRAGARRDRHDRRPSSSEILRATAAAGIDAARARGPRRELGPAARRSASGSPTPSSSPTEHLVEDFRMVKDAGEVARIRAACAIADDALGRRAPDAAGRADRARRSRSRSSSRCASGARAATSFDPIVASGPERREAARRGRRTGAIAPNELVVIDFGCIVDGYCSDMTRTVSVGDPGADARRLWDTVLLVAAGAGATRSRSASSARRSTGRAATSSTTPAGATRSCTGPATASASRSTRPREWPRRRVVPSLPATS